MMAHQLLLNAVLIIVMMFALDWYASRRTPHAARREGSHLRSLRRSARALPHDRLAARLRSPRVAGQAER